MVLIIGSVMPSRGTTQVALTAGLLRSDVHLADHFERPAVGLEANATKNAPYVRASYLVQPLRRASWLRLDAGLEYLVRHPIDLLEFSVSADPVTGFDQVFVFNYPAHRQSALPWSPDSSYAETTSTHWLQISLVPEVRFRIVTGVYASLSFGGYVGRQLNREEAEVGLEDLPRGFSRTLLSLVGNDTSAFTPVRYSRTAAGLRARGALGYAFGRYDVFAECAYSQALDPAYNLSGPTTRDVEPRWEEWFFGIGLRYFFREREEGKSHSSSP